MELVKENLWENRDWDPVYLCQIFDSDFNDFTDMWASSEVTDNEMIEQSQRLDYYSPITEDISLDDTILYTAVEKIEEE